MGYEQKHPYLAQIWYILRYAIQRDFKHLTSFIDSVLERLRNGG